jgi:hypothetical protein
MNVKHKLSFQDRFILASEREDLPFNTQFYFQSKDPFPIKELEKSLRDLISKKQYAPDSLGILQKLHKENLDLGSKIKMITKEQEDRFLFDKFKTTDVPVKIALYQCDSEYYLVFNFYHVFFDGHAQLLFLQDLFRLMKNEQLTPEESQASAHTHFLQYIKNIPVIWIFKYLISQFIKKKKKSKTVVANLTDMTPSDRVTAFNLIEIPQIDVNDKMKKSSLSSTAFYTFCATKAITRYLEHKEKKYDSIVLHIPKSMRGEIKAKSVYQNVIGFVWINFKPDFFKGDDAINRFRDFYKFRSTVNENRKVIFEMWLLDFLKSFKNLQKIFEYREKNRAECTLLISSGRTPHEFKFPDVFSTAKFYTRSTMFKSPGIGLFITSNNKTDYISIEYLKTSFSPGSVDLFQKMLLEEINSF